MSGLEKTMHGSLLSERKYLFSVSSLNSVSSVLWFLFMSDVFLVITPRDLSLVGPDPDNSFVGRLDQVIRWYVMKALASWFHLNMITPHF